MHTPTENEDGGGGVRVFGDPLEYSAQKQTRQLGTHADIVHRNQTIIQTISCSGSTCRMLIANSVHMQYSSFAHVQSGVKQSLSVFRQNKKGSNTCTCSNIVDKSGEE